MDIPSYNVDFDSSENQYFFESVGKNGKIKKVVKFIEIQDGIFNLGLGDFNQITNKIDDEVISDNADMPQVISTVINILIEFLNKNPLAYVSIEGNSKSRNRLYQMVINKYFYELSLIFEIYGLNSEKLETMEKNKSYDAFLVRKLF